MENTKKKAYDYLSELCKIKNVYPSCEPQISPLSNRAIYIINELNNLNLNYQLDVFDADNYDGKINYNLPKLLNIIVEFKSQNTKADTLIFLAHHDVNNTSSENCQDNSASICNLLELCSHIKERKIDFNICVVFSDKEEFGGVGAARLSTQINNKKFGNVKHVINLELTGRGDVVWIENPRGCKEKTELQSKLEGNFENVFYTPCPFNDAIVLRHYDIDAVCIGILPKEEIINKSLETWRLCHSINDTLDKANVEDMEIFVKNLLKFLN